MRDVVSKMHTASAAIEGLLVLKKNKRIQSAVYFCLTSPTIYQWVEYASTRSRLGTRHVAMLESAGAVHACCKRVTGEYLL
jgi:hypothetical protein